MIFVLQNMKISWVGVQQQKIKLAYLAFILTKTKK